MSLSYIEVIVEEIALEGLDGITLEALWKRLEARQDFKITLDTMYKDFIWNIIKKLETVDFYQLETERGELLICDENSYLSEEYCHNQDLLYPMSVVREEGVQGSCSTFKTRKNITNNVSELSLTEINTKYKNSFVIVASQAARKWVLFHGNVYSNLDLSDNMYVIIERIGRARFTGELLKKNYGILLVVHDNKTLFQNMKEILKYKIVRKQLVRAAHTIVSVNLFHLRRFYNIKLSLGQTVVQKCVEVLKQQKNYVISREKLVQHLDVREAAAFKRNRNSTLHKKFFEFKDLLLKDVEPDSSMRDEGATNPRNRRKNNNEKCAAVILKDPDIDISQLFDNEADSCDKDEADEVSHNQRIYYIDLFSTNQVYKVILDAGYKGVTACEIASQLCDIVKRISKTLSSLFSKGHLLSYIKDKGQLRNRVYVASVYKEELEQYQRSLLNKKQELKQIKDDKKPTLVTPAAVEEDLTPPAQVEVVNNNLENLSQSTLTKIKRTNMVRELVSKEQVVTFGKLIKTICKIEDESGYKYKMDKNSLLSILDVLVNEGYVRLVSGVCNSSGKLTPVGLVLANGVKDDDERITREAETSILHPNVNDFKLTKGLILVEKILVDSATVESSKMLNSLTNTPSPLIDSVKIIKKMKRAKFVKFRILHELLFYLTRGYDGQVDVPQDVLLNRLYESGEIDEPDMDLPRLYTDTVSWRMFINPLPHLSGWEPGWCMMADVLLRIPLSLFVELLNEKYEVEELNSYLHDKIKQHYLIKNLPATLHLLMFNKRNRDYLNYEIKRIACLGLLQIGCTVSNSPSRTFVYVNKRAMLLDTTTSQPGRYQVEDKDYEELKYEFVNSAVVTKYWDDMLNICMNTPLKTSAKRGDEKTFEAPKIREKPKLIECFRPVKRSEAPLNDKGQVPGDRLGAAGLDSILYSFSKLNWIKPKLLDERVSKVKKPVEQWTKVKKSKLIKLEHGKKRKLDGCEKKATPQPPKKKQKIKDIDKKDELAKQMLHTMRVTWSREEDNLILLCQSVKNYLNVKDLIKQKEFRNVLQTYVEKSIDKTQLSVLRRINFLLKNKVTLTSVENCTNDMKTMSDVRELCDKYAEQNVVNLFYKLVKLVKDKYLDSNHGLQVVPDVYIPDSLSEFYLKFVIEEPVLSDLDEETIFISVIREVILSSIFCSSDKTSQAVQLFKIYSQYSQELLRNTISLLRVQRILATKKMAQHSFKQYEALPLCSSPYSLSQKFHYLFLLKYKHKIYNEVFLACEKFLNRKEDKFEIDTNSPPLSLLCFQLCSREVLKLRVKTPDEAIVMDPRTKASDFNLKFLRQCRSLVKCQSESESQNFLQCIMELCSSHMDEGEDEEPPAKKQKNVDLELDHGCNSKQNTRTAVRMISLLLKEKFQGEKGNFINLSNQFFVINSSKVFVDYVSPVKQFKQFKVAESASVLDQIRRRAMISLYSQEHELIEVKVLNSSTHPHIEQCYNFIHSKGALGVTGHELKMNCFGDICKNLVQLMNMGLVLRVGINEIRYVTHSNSNPWLCKSVKLTKEQKDKLRPVQVAGIDVFSQNEPGKTGFVMNKRINLDVDMGIEELAVLISNKEHKIKLIMRPWLRVDGTVNRKVLDFLLGSTLNYIMLKPGLSLYELTKRFHPVLTCATMRDIVDILLIIDCVTIVSCSYSTRPNLFKSGSLILTDSTETENNSQIFVEAKVDAILKLGNFIGHKNYSRDFLQQ